MCPQGAFAKGEAMKSVSSDPTAFWCVSCQLCPISVNLTQPPSPLSNVLLLRKQVCQNVAWNTAFEKSGKSILVAQSLLFPESAKIYSYKFQTKFWINKSPPYLDYSPYIVFIFKIDVRNNFITYSLIQQISLWARLQYYGEEFKRLMVLKIF